MTDTLYAALLAAQSEAPGLQKNAINPHFKNRYVSLETLMDQILPILNQHGLVLLQAPTTLDGAPALRTAIVHAGTGEQVQDTMLLEASKRDPQGQGSAITYARRYSLMALLGLVADVDDDGNGASRPSGKRNSSAGQKTPAPDPGGEPAPAGPLRGRAPVTDGNQSPPGVISDSQRRRLFAIASEHKCPDDEVKRIVLEVGGVESTKQLPKAKYDAVVKAVEDYVPF